MRGGRGDTEMRLERPVIPGWSYRAGESWLHRLTRSSALAWSISLALHAVIFIGFYHAVFHEVRATRRLIIPEARLVPGDGSGSLASPTLQLSLSGQAPAPPAAMAAPGIGELAAAPSGGRPGDLSIVATEGGVGPPIAGESLTAAAVEAFGNRFAGVGGQGTRPGGSPAGSLGPPSSFFGQAGNAYRVVYVVDVSASVTELYVTEIVSQMRQSIRDLLPTQRFHIVLARPGRVQEFEPRRLVPAIGRYKTEASSFLDTISTSPGTGRADPIEAMRRAFAVGPELIYFLSDGDYRNIEEDLERTLEQLNAERQVRITVIGFEPAPEPSALLQRIATTHGGHFRAVVLK